MSEEVIQIDEQTYRIEDGGVRFFLLTGSKEALLIDSGMQVRNAREIAQKLTSLPIRLLNTHADIDHIGSNEEFDTFYMHPAECSNFYSSHKHTGAFTPVEDGEVLDLGNRPLKVILIPGHTPGSIAILDVNRRILFSGDSVQNGVIFMFGIQREIHAYQASLQKLLSRSNQFDFIYPSHSTCPLTPEIIPQLMDSVESILKEEASFEYVEMWGQKIRKFTTSAASFLME